MGSCGERLIVHVDVDAFAVSVARADDTCLRGRCVVVGNDAGGRGRVACASYEARKYGVRVGMPLAIVRRRLPETLILSPDPVQLCQSSARFHEVLAGMAPVVEVASLDDVYMDITGCRKLFGGDLLRWMRKVARCVENETGLPVSMGLGSNKMIARIATWLAKTGHGIAVMPSDEPAFLANAPVHLLPGVGNTITQRLLEYEIRSVGQLLEIGEERLCTLFGQAGGALWKCARGEWPDPVKPTAVHRLIVHGHVFEPDTVNPELLSSAASLLTQRLAWDLRRNGARCGSVELVLTYSDGGSSTRTIRPGLLANSESVFWPLIRAALFAMFQRRVRVRKLNLCARYEHEHVGQRDFLELHAQERCENLQSSIDRVRARHGLRSLVSATALHPVGRAIAR